MALFIKRKTGLPLGRIFLIFGLITLVGAGGWFGFRWYTTGEEPPLVSVAAADPRVSEADVSTADIASYTVADKNPRYISIPKLDVVKARVQKVGITANNELDMPKNIHDAAWYERSMKPGSGYGAVLIDGHASGVSKDGVFAKLKILEEGDHITVERGDGKEFTYSVVENKSMPLEEVLKTGMKKMMQSAESGSEGLSLITTDGKWIPRYQQFDHRIMLRAVLVED